MNKPYSISLEKLKTGTLRATGRSEGRTVAIHEGNDGRLLVFRAMKDTASQHAYPTGGFDMTYISLNDAAMTALYPSR